MDAAVMTLIILRSLLLGVVIFTAYWTFRTSQIRPPPPQDEQQVATTPLPRPIDDYYRELARLTTQGLDSVKRMGKDERADKQVRELANMVIPQRILRQVH